MGKGTFTLKWKNNGEVFSKEIDRTTFQELMESIRVHFYNNNEISTQFVKLIPKIDTLEIDMDRNRDLDVPMVTCTIGQNKKMVKINRNHRIIWNILDTSCQL